MHVPAVGFTLAASRPALAPGDTLHLVATLANPGRDTLRLEFADGCALTHYVRSEPDRAIVEPVYEPRTCRRDPWIVVLPPEATRSFAHAWVTPAEGGTFTAYAVLHEHHAVRAGEREFKAGHRSNEVAVTVGR
jgi:hypothetical protein